MNNYWKLTTPGKGTVDLINYDFGMVVDTLGCVERVINDIPTYSLDLPGGCGGIVPVFMSTPDPITTKETMPHIVITRSSVDENGQRIHPGDVQWQDRWDDSPPIGTSGFYKKMEESIQAWPYDISYDLDIRGQTRREAQNIYTWIMFNTTLKPRGYMTLHDTAGDVRTYNVVFDSISNADEIEDVNMRFPGLTITVRVLGELDIYNTEVSTLAQRTQTVMERK